MLIFLLSAIHIFRTEDNGQADNDEIINMVHSSRLSKYVDGFAGKRWEIFFARRMGNNPATVSHFWNTFFIPGLRTLTIDLPLARPLSSSQHQQPLKRMTLFFTSHKSFLWGHNEKQFPGFEPSTYHLRDHHHHHLTMSSSGKDRAIYFTWIFSQRPFSITDASPAPGHNKMAIAESASHPTQSASHPTQSQIERRKASWKKNQLMIPLTPFCTHISFINRNHQHMRSFGRIFVFRSFPWTLR